jgi:transposase
MDTLYAACAGLETRNEKVVACICRLVGGTVRQEVRTFHPDTNQLLDLADWLAEGQVTHMAMEPTGPHWKAVYDLFEGAFELLLVNAEHIKQVPGRKTGVEDSQWIAELLQHGLLRPGLAPERPAPHLRDLTQERARLVRQKVQAANRIQKLLEGANIGWTGVASDLLGAALRDRIRAIVRGEKATAVSPDLRQPSREIGGHQRFLLGLLLDEVEFLDKQKGRLSHRIAELVTVPCAEVGRLPAIPENYRPSAEKAVAEKEPREPRQVSQQANEGGVRVAGHSQGAGGADGRPRQEKVSGEGEGPAPDPVAAEEAGAVVAQSQPPRGRVSGAEEGEQLPGLDSRLPEPADEQGPPAEALTGAIKEARREKRSGRRVRVIKDAAKYRHHRRKKLLRILLRMFVWLLALVIIGVIFWLVLDRLMKPPRE